MKLLITSLLAKIETTSGTDSVPTGAANAVLLRGNPTLSPMEAPEDKRNIILPYFGNQGSMQSSAAFGKLDFEFELAGSGTAATPPSYGPILRGCGLAENILAAPLTGTAQVGGGTLGIKLAATASAIDNFYNGMPIAITAGTGSGDSGIIIDYDGTTKIATVVSGTWVTMDATSTYSIGASVAYRPATTGLESLSMYFNIDGVLHKFLGSRGNAVFNIAADKIPFAKASFDGIYVPVVDGASPTVVVSGWQRPMISNTVNTPFFGLHGFATAAMDSLSIDLGNAISRVSRIGAAQRVDQTNRTPVGNVSVEAVTVATKDWFGIVRAGTQGSLGLINGTAAGNKFALSAPAVTLRAPKYSDSNGTAMLGMSMDISPVSGNDEFAFCTY